MIYITPSTFPFIADPLYGLWLGGSSTHPYAVERLPIVLTDPASTVPNGAICSERVTKVGPNCYVSAIVYSDRPRQLPQDFINHLRAFVPAPRVERIEGVAVGFGQAIEELYGGEVGKALYGEFAYNLQIPYQNYVIDLLRLPLANLVAHLPPEFPFYFVLLFLPDRTNLILNYFRLFPTPPDLERFKLFILERSTPFVATQLVKLAVALGFAAISAGEVAPENHKFILTDGLLYITPKAPIPFPAIGVKEYDHQSLHHFVLNAISPSSPSDFSPLPVLDVGRTVSCTIYLAAYEIVYEVGKVIGYGFAKLPDRLREFLFVLPLCLVPKIEEAISVNAWLRVEYQAPDLYSAWHERAWHVAIVPELPPPLITRPKEDINRMIALLHQMHMRKRIWATRRKK